MFKKIITSVVISASCLTIIHCVDDDICISSTTPRLSFQIVKPNADTVTTYTLDSLYIDKVNSDGTIQSVGKWGGISEGKLPLNTDSDKTVFYLYKTNESANPPKDIITVSYQKEQQFISKACGFKFVFNNVSYELTQSEFVEKLIPNSIEINDESKNNLLIICNPAQ